MTTTRLNAAIRRHGGLGEDASEQEMFLAYSDKVANEYPVGAGIDVPRMGKGRIANHVLLQDGEGRIALTVAFGGSVRHLVEVTPRGEVVVLPESHTHTMCAKTVLQVRSAIEKGSLFTQDRYRSGELFAA